MDPILPGRRAPPGWRSFTVKECANLPPAARCDDVCSAPVKEALSRAPQAFRWWQRGLRLGIFMLILWTVVGTVGFI